MPEDPIGPLAEGAAQLHQVFLAYIQSGFTEAQALYLAGQIVNASIRGPS